MRRVILGMLILICCVHSAQCQDQRGSSQTTRGDGPVREACRAEIEKFCRGEERAGRCLRSRDPNELSEKCKTALANRGTR